MVNIAKIQLLNKTLKSKLGSRVDLHAIEKWSSTFWSLKGRRGLNRGEPFMMMFPPPNITGNLHLGHALTGAVQDAIIRYQMMRGRDVKWIPGFDHAGLATQNIVEKLIWSEKRMNRSQLNRDELIDRANEWKDLKRQEMRTQLNRLGLALDYDQEYFTMDDKSSIAVQTAFKKLFDSGIIYRAIKPVFWSEQQMTTLSDIEVERVNDEYRYFRTGEVVQRKPIMQWFVNANAMAHRAVEAVENSTIDIIPPNYKNSWSDWLIANGVQDWCISRQGWWGHTIPAYKLESSSDSQENWIVADSIDEAINRLGSSDKVVQDPDVLDTWFSSSLLPLTISGWPDEKLFSSNCEKGYFPLHLMETGFDILNFWVSKMVMMALELEGRIPFNVILLHGMISDSKGKKMSKTKGNVIDPLDLIDGALLSDLQDRTIASQSKGIIETSQLMNVLVDQKKMFPRGIPSCGADGLRAYLLSHNIQEEVVPIQVNQVENIRRLSNKIWNIYRFVLQLLEDLDKSYLEADLDKCQLDDTDRQLLSELAKCAEVAHKSLNDTYNLHHMVNSVEKFWSKHLSAIYMESSKLVFNRTEGSEEERTRKIRVLVESVVLSTQILHPIMPHITEFLYQKLNCDLKKSDLAEPDLIKSIVEKPYPEVRDVKKYLNM